MKNAIHKMVDARLDTCIEENPDKEVEVAKWADEQVFLVTVGENEGCQ